MLCFPLSTGVSEVQLFWLYVSPHYAVSFFQGHKHGIEVFLSIIIGLGAGILIGEFTEYCTSYRVPTQGIAKKVKLGQQLLLFKAWALA